MLALRSRQDGFRLQIPKEFIPEPVNAKYSKILQEKRGFITKPIDFLNETIQRIEVLGFNNATVAQQQPNRGEPVFRQNRIAENNFMHGASPVTYRAGVSPQALIDKTLNVVFRHTLGYLNYFIIFESFLYHYSRDMKSTELPRRLTVDLLDEKGVIYAKIVLEDPLIDGIDMLEFDYTKPVAQSQTFQVVFKYSAFDYQLIEAEKSNARGEVE